MADIRDVAKEAGVSPSTVSRVLNNYDNVTEPTRKKVEDACNKLNYIPNANATNLRSGKTDIISFVVPAIDNPFFANALKGLENKALEYNYKTIVCNTDNNIKIERNYLKMLLEKSIDGLVLATSDSYTSYTNYYEMSEEHNIPIVLFDRKLRNAEDNFDIVLGDSYLGAIKAVEHLIEVGYKNIGILTASLNLSTSKERLDGYKKALKNNNIPIKDENIWIDKRIGGFSIERGYSLTKENILEMENVPEAFFVGNNFMAAGMYKALKEENIKVPEDIAITCFDDLNLIHEINPFFTVMNQPSYKMGEKAAEILIERIENKNQEPPKKIIFQPELIIRDSSVK